jgi:predicted  nucleic acid-binding Zn-ribbon protein
MEREFEHRLTEVETRAKSNQHRLDEMEKRQDNLDDLVSTVKVLADREERVEDDVKEIKGDVKSLKDKPAKRWETIVNNIIWAVVGAVIVYLLNQIGL